MPHSSNKHVVIPATASTTERSPIFVTQPSVPPLEELTPLLEAIWRTRVLSNGAAFHQQFEKALCDYLGVRHLVLVANATLGLILALKYLKIQGEVITTPFSFVATGNALLWAGLTPVFADIDPKTLNLRPDSVAAAISPRTQAIMPVHCFGQRCDVEGLHALAREHGLSVLYDAAHAFGVCDWGGSILRHGDLSVVSFHATKVFNTGEGGAIICPDAESKAALDQLVNHGKIDEQRVEQVGLNAKMSEIVAALGCVQLRHIDAEIAKRSAVDRRYRELLQGISGIHVLERDPTCRSNYYSFPVIVDESSYGESRDSLNDRLRRHNIQARRYFSPLISQLPAFKNLDSARSGRLPVATLVASRILGLPLYPDLPSDRQEEIAALIRAR